MNVLHEEALRIEGEAWKVVKAFDDAAEGKDRTVAYAAMILIMTSFCKTSETAAATILTDFANRVDGGRTVLSVRQ